MLSVSGRHFSFSFHSSTQQWPEGTDEWENNNQCSNWLAFIIYLLEGARKKWIMHGMKVANIRTCLIWARAHTHKLPIRMHHLNAYVGQPSKHHLHYSMQQCWMLSLLKSTVLSQNFVCASCSLRLHGRQWHGLMGNGSVFLLFDWEAVKTYQSNYRLVSNENLTFWLVTKALVRAYEIGVIHKKVAREMSEMFECTLHRLFDRPRDLWALIYSQFTVSYKAFYSWEHYKWTQYNANQIN